MGIVPNVCNEDGSIAAIATQPVKSGACGVMATDMDIKDRIGIIGVVVVSAEEVATGLQFFCACPRV